MVLPAFRYLGVDRDQVNLGGLRITRTHYPPRQVQPWHSHENANFHFLLAGSFLDESPDWGERHPSTFSLVYHPAGSRHRTVSGPRGRNGLNIEPDEAWLSGYGLPRQAYAAHPNSPDVSLALVAVALGAYSAELLGGAVFESLFVDSVSEKETPGWFKRLESLVKEDDASRWTLSSLAAEVSVHPVYLARTFRSRYGTSLTDHLQRLRLLRGIRMLEASNNLAMVAIEAGFSDHAHFTRSFKAWFKITPSQARDELRQVSMIQAFEDSASLE